MLPETDFHRAGKLMFVIAKGRYFNTSNSEVVDQDYLTLCGLRFPLKQGRTLEEEESTYLRRNHKSLQEVKTQIEKEINSGAGINDLTRELELQEDIYFFLTSICKPENTHLKLDEGSPVFTSTGKLLEDSTLILPELLNGEYVVMNTRLYPLILTTEPVFVHLNGQGYTINTSKMTINDVEKSFHKTLETRLRMQVMRDSKKISGINERIFVLKEKISALERGLGIVRYAHCLECGDFGFDISSRYVYWLIAPHYNETTGRSYSEGESAAAITFSKGVLGSSASFAERNDRNSPFYLNSTSPCMGFGLEGSSIEDKMFYLEKWANNVAVNKKIRAEQNNTDDNY